MLITAAAGFMWETRRELRTQNVKFNGHRLSRASREKILRAKATFATSGVFVPCARAQGGNPAPVRAMRPLMVRGAPSTMPPKWAERNLRFTDKARSSGVHWGNKKTSYVRLRELIDECIIDAENGKF